MTDMLTAGVGAAFGGLVTLATGAVTVNAKLARLRGDVAAIGRELTDFVKRLERLETMHLGGHGGGL